MASIAEVDELAPADGDVPDVVLLELDPLDVQADAASATAATAAPILTDVVRETM